MSFFVPTKFTWSFGGHQVHLCGSFTRWVETVPMAPVEGQPGVFAVVVHLPPGYHQYKFIVDGEWRHDETQPFMPDPLGNVNNWLFVRRTEMTPPGIPVMHGATHGSPVSFMPDCRSQLTVGVPAPAAGQANNPFPSGRPASPGAAPGAAAAAAAGGGCPTGDVDMAAAEGSGGGSTSGGVIPPIAVQHEEPSFTRKKITEFLHAHSAYELIPESGKVVLLDVELPVRQAFHALHEQGIVSAPLWDPRSASIVGMISASDFIHILRKLRNSISHGANPMSEPEMDQHTIRNLREEGATEGRRPRPLVYCKPEDNLHTVVQRLFDNHCSMAPILSKDPEGCNDANVLHIATISGVLSCIMRHFRASVSSLPLLSTPVGRLPIGTWSPDSTVTRGEEETAAAAAAGAPQEGQERRDTRRQVSLRTVQPGTPLTTALQLLLDEGVSVLPVVDASGALLDMYARSDISMLAKGNSYNRLQWEELTVGQALSLANSPVGGSGPGGSFSPTHQGTPPQRQQRVFMCTVADPLRVVVERLSIPGVRRLFVVEAETRRVEGIISLSDVAAYLFL